MRNVTITLDEEVARWVRVRAAREDTSMSRYVSELLREQMIREDRYAGAMRSFFSRPVRAISRDGRYPTREELHERDLLR